MDLPHLSLSSSIGFVYGSSFDFQEKETPTKKIATSYEFPFAQVSEEEDITPMISHVPDVLFQVIVSQEGKEFHSFAFKDDGCSVCLIHPDLVEFTGFKKLPLSHPIRLSAIDKSFFKNSGVHEFVRVKLKVGGHYEKIELGVSSVVGRNAIVLGRGWQARHFAQVDFAHEKIRFTDSSCKQHILNHEDTVPLIHQRPPIVPYKDKASTPT